MTEKQKAGTLMNHQLEADTHLAKVSAKASASASAGKSKASATSRSVANKAKPANQYGSKIKSRFKKNDFTLTIATGLQSLKAKLLQPVPEGTDVTEFVETSLTTFVKDCVAATMDQLTDMIDSGYSVAKEQYLDQNPEYNKEFEPIGERSLSRFRTNFIAGSYWKVLNPYKSQIVNNLTPDDDGNTSAFLLIKTIESIKKSMESLAADQLDTCYRFGFIRFAKRMGYKNIELVDATSKAVVEQISIADVIYKEFIPTPNNADCDVRLPLGDTQ